MWAGCAKGSERIAVINCEIYTSLTSWWGAFCAAFEQCCRSHSLTPSLSLWPLCHFRSNTQRHRGHHFMINGSKRQFFSLALSLSLGPVWMMEEASSREREKESHKVLELFTFPQSRASLLSSRCKAPCCCSLARSLFLCRFSISFIPCECEWEDLAWMKEWMEAARRKARWKLLNRVRDVWNAFCCEFNGFLKFEFFSFQTDTNAIYREALTNWRHLHQKIELETTKQRSEKCEMSKNGISAWLNRIKSISSLCNKEMALNIHSIHQQ
jgi:hypothetical protein